jgi:hypothetical protein
MRIRVRSAHPPPQSRPLSPPTESWGESEPEQIAGGAKRPLPGDGSARGMTGRDAGRDGRPVPTWLTVSTGAGFWRFKATRNALEARTEAKG